MAGPRPQDDYNPNNTVAPTGAPNDYLQVRSNPTDFGSQVGQANQGLGKTLDNSGNEVMSYALQAQGLANEHAANMAEMQLAVQGGEVYNQYKNLEGQDAANARPKAIQEYMDVNNKIRDSLSNPAAQRAYDTLATRRMSFTIQDMNSYAATEQKKAYRQGRESMIKLSEDSAARPEVANDPAQLSDAKAGIIFNANASFTAPGYGAFQTLPVTTDKTTGKLQFDQSTNQGKSAQAQYDEYLQEHVGRMYENAATIIATDPVNPNVAKAVDFLQKYKSDMSAATYAQISTKLSGPYRNEQSRVISEGVLGNAQQEYNGSLGSNAHGQVYATNAVNVTDPKTNQFVNPTTPADGVTLGVNNLRGDLYRGKTLTEIAKTWTGEPEKAATWAQTVHDISKVGLDEVPNLNNPVVVKQLLRGMIAAEKSPEDRKAFNDSVIEQGVNNSFSGLKANVSAGHSVDLSGRITQSYADYIGEHQDELIERARQTAADHGFDAVGQDMAADRLKGRIAELRSFQSAEVHSLFNSVYSKVMDDKHPITNMTALDYGDPETKAAWVRLQSLDSYRAGSLERMVTANAHNKSNTYGTDFYPHLNDVLTGKITDLSQIQSYFGGDNTPISNSGIRALSPILDDMKTPQGQGFRHAEANFLKMAQGQITGSSVFPGINSAVLGPKFDKYLMAAVPQIEAKRQDMIKQGKDPSTMFNPESQDYIGKGVVAPSQGELTKAMSSSMFSQPGGVSVTAPVTTINPGATQISYNSPDDIGKAYQDGKLTRAQAKDLIVKKFGGFAPPIPKPTD